ncbi:Nonribosomal peptide synthetase 1-like protein 2 [Colletotrichum chlorophyti]|uniref:Nonribosomal peptide synthetase 1-like protein 2 n=1 Tax=Colletotrichum chlorophyti TaxID=708187 RepID=A0A1Q8S7S7_9PEZI|nr:Nonribosomal peptide synthetase 1-like protein 2 [Colletotrichum chlorophyti]
MATNPRETRLVIRLPHAKYDGISLPITLSSLRDAYIDPEEPLPPSPSFLALLHQSQALQTSALDFWCEELNGTGITNVLGNGILDVDNNSPSGNDTSIGWNHLPQPVTTTLKHTLQLQTAHAFTTVLEAAWAATLAQFTAAQNGGDEDKAIVFGEIVANRTTPLDGVDSVVGLCTNTIPVVVRGEKLFQGSLPGKFNSTVTYMDLEAVKWFDPKAVAFTDINNNAGLPETDQWTRPWTGTFRMGWRGPSALAFADIAMRPPRYWRKMTGLLGDDSGDA